MTEIFGLFPGQGSQKVGMGKDLFDRYELAREIFTRADETLGFPLSKICFEGPAERLTMTEIAQPALLTVSTVCYRLAFVDSEISRSHRIVAASGHSLGEYSALVAANSLSFEEAVSLVHKRGKYMQEAVPIGTGRMIAVLGKEIAEIEAALAKVTGEVAEVANVNAPGQIVVAGSVRGIESFVEHLGTGKVIELTVSAPFHCTLMKAAEQKLRVDLQKVTIQKPEFPVFQNFSASKSDSPNEIRENLAKQVCGKVRWVECVTNAINAFKPTAAWEFGSGSVLTGLARRIAPDLARVNIDSVAALEKSMAV